MWKLFIDSLKYGYKKPSANFALNFFITAIITFLLILASFKIGWILFIVIVLSFLKEIRDIIKFGLKNYWKKAVMDIIPRLLGILVVYLGTL